jgi:hypothetical protein
MQLRNHPQMSYRQVSSWPPLWMWIGGKENKRPKGEVGILKRVNGEPIIHRCFLWIEYEESTYLGCLMLSNAAFCERVFKVLQENVGRSIEDIGSIDLSHLG